MLLRNLALCVCMFGSISVAMGVAAQESKPDAAPDAVQLKKLFEEVASRLTLGRDGVEPLQLVKRPVLNWSNPERRTAAGAIYLWIDKGRPLAAVCVYPSGAGRYDLEFQSLSEHPFSIADGEERIWQPNAAGIEWKEIGTTQPIANTAAKRLVQMRRLARKFEAKLVPPHRTSIPLRRLEQPIHRYPSGQLDRQFIDGAVFAFVQGTDPEVLLMIESARSDDDSTRWRYALARMSMVPTEVRMDKDLVWETQWAIKRRTGPYHVVPFQQ